MKNLIVIITLLSGHSLMANASIRQSFLDNSNDPTAVLKTLEKDEDPRTKAFIIRLKEFELYEVKNPLQTSAKKETSREVIRSLTADLRGAYFSSASRELGDCLKRPCLFTEGEQLKFKGASGEKHCYPSTDCSYYKCMEEKYECSEVGYNYFTELARPTCSSYVDRVGKGKFSSDGVEWIYTVMVCLQKGLFEECALRGNCSEENRTKTCEHIVEFTLDFHPGCYIESGVGVCKLPFKDQLAIWKTVGPYLTNRERVEAFKVVYQCFFK